MKNPVIYLITIECIVNQWLLLQWQRKMRASSQTKTSIQPADNSVLKSCLNLWIWFQCSLEKHTVQAIIPHNPGKFTASISMLWKIIAAMISEKIIKYIHIFKALVWLASTKNYLLGYLEFPVSSKGMFVFIDKEISFAQPFLDVLFCCFKQLIWNSSHIAFCSTC